eukprot:Opistho-2@44976
MDPKEEMFRVACLKACEASRKWADAVVAGGELGLIGMDLTKEMRQHIDEHNKRVNKGPFSISETLIENIMVPIGVVKIRCAIEGHGVSNHHMKLSGTVTAVELLDVIMHRLGHSDLIADHVVSFSASDGGLSVPMPDATRPLVARMLLNMPDKALSDSVMFEIRKRLVPLSKSVSPKAVRRRSGEEVLLKDGYLNMKSMIIGQDKSWSVRYFKLTENYIAYYKSAKAMEPVEAFPLSMITEVEYVADDVFGRANCFRIAVPSYVFLMAMDESTRSEWITALRIATGILSQRSSDGLLAAATPVTTEMKMHVDASRRISGDLSKRAAKAAFESGTSRTIGRRTMGTRVSLRDLAMVSADGKELTGTMGSIGEFGSMMVRTGEFGGPDLGSLTFKDMPAGKSHNDTIKLNWASIPMNILECFLSSIARSEELEVQRIRERRDFHKRLLDASIKQLQAA